MTSLIPKLKGIVKLIYQVVLCSILTYINSQQGAVSMEMSTLWMTFPHETLPHLAAYSRLYAHSSLGELCCIAEIIFTVSTASATSCTRKMLAPFIKLAAWMAVVPFKAVDASPPTNW